MRSLNKIFQKEAIDSKLKSIVANRTWELVELLELNPYGVNGYL